MEFYHIVRQFEDFIDSKTKLMLEENRLINFHIVAPHSTKIKKPKQLYKFNWEKEENKILSPEKYNELMALLGVPEGITVVN